MQIIGHRGARYEAPENTIPGFHYAVDLGVSAIEFDIRLTADEQLVVIHDATVDRTTNGTGEIHTFTLEEIQALDARAIFPDWPEPCRVPTFAEVLNVIESLPDLMIEIKDDDSERLDITVPLVLAEIARRGLDDQVTITSFKTYPLEIAQRLAPHIRRGFIGAWDTRDYLDTALRLGARQVDANHTTADRALVAEAKAMGLRVVAWPTNSQAELESVLTLQPDLFCTDRPSLLTDLYAATVETTDA
jgi:glycerophosphoryl diester phosphodiesterase